MGEKEEAKRWQGILNVSVQKKNCMDGLTISENGVKLLLV